TRRYRVKGVVDSRYAGHDAGEILDGAPSGIPIYSDIESAVAAESKKGGQISHLVFGIAPDGGILEDYMRKDLLSAIRMGLNVDCGMHYFLSEDPEMTAAARESGAVIRDVRKTPPRNELHGFTGRIKEVESFRIALLGTDSSVGKRTAAWKLVDAFEERGIRTAFIGTGQTAWLQGARYGVIMDALINDFVAGEIEHEILRAWDTERPMVMVIEGQGSLMNPIFPGGFEILSAGQPHAVVMQHAPRRVDYDGLEDTPIHPLDIQIQAVELLSGKPVVAITMNHEGMSRDEIDGECERLSAEIGLPVKDPLVHRLDEIVEALQKLFPPRG
ncbi:MAG: DUF1611 domain-containing protein, partial [Spirochaetota bacterium]|nr:DUF1611 domain-containing protein [Spirochaetota bacterium]